MQKSSVKIFVFFGLAVLPAICLSQVTIRSGLSLTSLNIEKQWQQTIQGIHSSLGYEIPMSWRKRNVIYLCPQINYTSFFSEQNEQKFALKSIIGFTPSVKLLFKRHSRICLRWPKVPMWYFRKYIKAGASFQLRNFIESEKKQFAIAPYFAAGSTFAIWKKHRLKLEIAAVPDIYSTKINSYKVRSITTNISLGFYIAS